MSSNGFFSSQRNSRHRNANAGTTLKRRNDNRGYNGTGGFQEERNRYYAPPQKRLRSQPQTQTQTQTQFRSGMNLPLYHHHHGISNNMSRVSQSYNNYGDVITSNSSFVSPNNDSNTNHHRYQNPNPQIVPIPLAYRKLDDISFDSLSEWAPNQALNPNANPQVSAFTNVPNSLPLNHSNMASIVSQAMPQPIVLGKELLDLLSILNNEKEKETSEASNSYKLPPGLSFDDPSSLKVRHESVIKSLYSDMPRQCSSCGVRFKSQEDHSNHMDWHVRKNRSKATTKQGQKPKKSRDWFASTPLWLSAATGGTVESAKASFGEVQKEEHQEEHVVPADEDQKLCALCEERFEDFFSHEADDWMYKDAVYLTKNGPIVHVKCMPETRLAKDSIKPRVMSASVASAIVC